MSTKILTIDQGTTSSRTVLFNENLKVLNQSQLEYPLIYPADGWVEIDPSILLNSIHETLSSFKNEKINNVAITNQRETTIVWDRKTGIPVYNAIVWQDRRTSDYCESLRTQHIKTMVLDKTGLVLDPYFSATKIKWILDNVDGARDKAIRGDLCFGTVDTFLMFKLSSGKIFKTDFTNASRTMLFNINTLSWDKDLLKLFDIPESMLPEPVACDSNFGEIEFANNPCINAVLGDQHAALFGQNCLDKGQMKSTYGTGCFLMVNTGLKPVTSKDGLLTTLAFHWQGKCHYALEGSIYSAGTVVQWLRDGLMLFKESKDCEKYLDENFKTNNLIFVPAFNGLGTPFWNSDIRSSFHGITRDTSKSNIVTAALASISYQTNEIVTCLSKAGVEIDELKIDGGMTINKWFRRHLATTLDIDILTPENPESTALGVTIMSLINSNVVDKGIFKLLNFSRTTATKSLVNDVQKDNIKWRKHIEKEIKSIS